MGRPRAEFDESAMYDMLSLGLSQKDMSEELGASIPTISKKIAELTEDQGILLKYRELQSLQLTKIQARVLDSITPDKIAEAPLRDLVFAFKVLKDKELVTDGKPTEIHGLVSYLVQLEKAEFAQTSHSTIVIDDAEYTVDDIPKI